jgi:hypothetical protein
MNIHLYHIGYIPSGVRPTCPKTCLDFSEFSSAAIVSFHFGQSETADMSKDSLLWPRGRILVRL